MRSHRTNTPLQTRLATLFANGGFVLAAGLGACAPDPDMIPGPIEPLQDDLDDGELGEIGPMTNDLAIEPGADELACPTAAQHEPAVIVLTGVQFVDVMLPWRPQELELLAEGSEPEPMRCLDARCTRWAGGFGRHGYFRVDALICGERLTAAAHVEERDDGCGVDTHWIALLASEAMCFTNDYLPE